MQQTAPGLFVEPLDSAARRHAASGLYRDVFGYADSAHAVSPRLLRALLDHGGSALGAYDGDGATLGFCYGFSAVDGDGVYHYSQAVAVHERARGLGVGRALKLAQAEVARSAGARSMRWAFDPTLTRNAHFNLGVLGAKVTAFHPEYYDEPGTDRAIAHWTLDHTSHQVEREAAAAAVDRSQRAADAAATAGDPPGAILSGDGQLDGGRRLRWLRVTVDPASPAGEVTATAAPAVTSWLASGLDDGMVLVACLPSRLAASRPASVPEALYVLGEEPCR